MTLKKTISLIALCIVVIGASFSSWAIAVPITNHSFEADDVSGEANQLDGDIVPFGWTAFDDGRNNATAGDARGLVYHGPGASAVGPTLGQNDGSQSFFTAQRDIYQTISTSLEANTTYTLTIAIGDRDIAGAGGNSGTPAVKLGYGTIPGSNIFLELNQVNQLAQVNGQWVEWTGQYTTGATPVGQGQTLRIELTNGTNVGWFDNVRLTVDSTPSPPPSIDVYLLGGQSNMQGVGRQSKLPAELLSVPAIKFYHSSATPSTGGANQWITLRPAGFDSASFGPEIGFGEVFADLCRGANIAFIKHAVGGTNLISNWNPGADASDTGNWGPQFTTFVNTANSAIAALEADGYTPVVKGMIWMQGERDATNVGNSNVYGANLSHFIGRIREQFAAHTSPDGIRFVAGQVLPYAPAGGQVVSDYPGYLTVRQAILNADEGSGAALSVANTAAVLTNTIDHPTHEQEVDGYRDTDEVHLNATAQLALGRSMAYRMMELVPITYAQWSLDYGLIGGQTEDEDEDGLNNLSEFFLGSDPLDASSVARPASSIENIGGLDYLTLTYSRNLNAFGFQSDVEISEDLVNWNNGVLPVFVETVRVSNGIKSFKYRTPWSITDPLRVRMFLRLKISP